MSPWHWLLLVFIILLFIIYLFIYLFIYFVIRYLPTVNKGLNKYKKVKEIALVEFIELYFIIAVIYSSFNSLKRGNDKVLKFYVYPSSY